MKEELKDTKQFSELYVKEQDRLTKKWQRYFKLYGSGISMLRLPDLNNLIERASIPHFMRGELWQVFAGSHAKFLVHQGLYQQLLEKQKEQLSPSSDEIDKDLHRSLDHPYFKNEEAIESLRNVLIAFSWKNPVIGYCQSMVNNPKKKRKTLDFFF